MRWEAGLSVDDRGSGGADSDKRDRSANWEITHLSVLLLSEVSSGAQGDVMVFTTQSAIVREKWLDDGTTGGKKMYQTADGRWWVETSRRGDGTGDVIAHKIGDIVKWGA